MKERISTWEEPITKSPKIQAEQGIEDAFNSFGGYLIRFLENRGLTHEDAEDIAQTSWLKAWQHNDTFDSEKGQIITWMIRIVSNTQVDEIRKKSRRKTIPLETDDSEYELQLEDWTDLPDEQAIARVEAEWLYEKINKLPPTQAATIKLNSIQGIPQTEIALQTNTPLGTVKTRIRTGQMKLKEMFSNEGITRYQDLFTPLVSAAGDSEYVSRQ